MHRWTPKVIYCFAVLLIVGGTAVWSGETPATSTTLATPPLDSTATLDNRYSATAQPAATATSVLLIEAGGRTFSSQQATSINPGLGLHGRDDYLQLIVTLQNASGETRDVTREVTYTAEPAEILNIGASGFVTAAANGQATITATLNDAELSAQFQLTVTSFDTELPINFPNEVVPLFTKLGCNSGGCHGKASGQNGFRLSLLGFVPQDDYEYLVKESRGRRVFPAAPEQSLLLQKATGAVPHGGGVRLEAGSYEYRLLRRWITQGMPYGQPTDPVVERIEAVPPERTLPAQSHQQFAVLAHYSDGSVRDVTRLAQLESNSADMAEVTKTGLVSTADLTGSVAVMTRFAGHVAAFRANIPLGASGGDWPEPRNFIDDAVFARLRDLGIPPSPVADDATFLRRVTIDLAGRLPTVAEAEAFLADERPMKRDDLIERLLASGDYADYFANKWSAILRVKRAGNSSVRANLAFHDWIRDSLLANKPYDQFVGEVLTASGGPDQNPPVVWFKEVRTAEEQVEDVAQLFLGLRIQCAKCHHHPFEKWSQDDYFSFAAFFSRVARKNDATPGQELIFHRRGIAQAQNPKSGEQRKPAGLDGPQLEISADADPRQELVDWMTDAENPFFARSLVNRYWKHFFGRGIVDPEDDMRITNPPSNPELLTGLEQHFISHGYDLKDLVRTICQSQAYQLSSLPNEWNAKDKQSHSHWMPARLNAEVLLDAIDQLTGANTPLAGLPAQMRAVQLPDSAGSNYFLDVFGRPEADSACECERSSEANLAQSLHLLNSQDVARKLADSNGRAKRFAEDTKRGDAEKVRELYLIAYSRPPSTEELSIAVAHLEKHPGAKAQAYEDLIWTLLNTKEFLFNH